MDDKKIEYNMKIIIICILSSLATNIGFLFTFISKKYQDIILTLSLSLSGCLMILISITELIPESLFLVEKGNKVIIFITSMLILIICNLIIKKINIKDNNELKRVGILNAIGLFLHNIPEGIICATTSIKNIKLGIHTCLTIMIHNIPEGMSIAIPIYNATQSRVEALKPTLISSLGELLGLLLSITLLRGRINNILLYIILMSTAGIMISISINNTLKELKDKNKIINLIGLLISVGIIMILK